MKFDLDPAHVEIQEEARSLARVVEPFAEEADEMSEIHPGVLEAVSRLLAPGGTLYFSTNLRSFKLDEAALPEFERVDVSKQTHDEDFSRKPLHACWRFSRIS